MYESALFVTFVCEVFSQDRDGSHVRFFFLGLSQTLESVFPLRARD